MRRLDNGVVRPDWRQQLATQGIVYNNEMPAPDGGTMSYWREDSFYDFTSSEIDALSTSAATLFEMCVAAGDFIIDHNMFQLLGIPEFAWDQIKRTWWDDETEPGGRSKGDFSPSIFGRFDIRYSGEYAGKPQLLEFNADTPTSLPEAAVAQWYWLQQTGQGKDQWNQLHEMLVAAWARNLQRLRQARTHLLSPMTIHFACDREEESGEDLFNTEYMMETARQALEPLGYRTKFLYMDEIRAGDVQAGDRFYDSEGQHIDAIFKLYPWEWMLGEQFAKQCFRDMSDPRRDSTVWIEPPYKMLWSNKGLLPILWHIYGDDPEKRDLLLPAYFESERPAWMTSYVRKPLLGREGANVSIIVDGVTKTSTPGEYGGPFVCQAFAPLPAFPDRRGVEWHPVLGVWMIDGEPAGLGIRESAGLITDNMSNFVPHTIDHSGI
ncbi:glutathionylspermidine synthase family protein [Dactylosporangium matsuzakiense]|uniref:Glutathionylspermidine synthase n=1 Tax=Dactylosporangium matsuzakiense TaxID=53360 RepID=A0A9W6KPX8_9ACTN|nr:glutathionylspermidine synthase family protein [Dactylosporangium matsuzakiense]UWZ43643.1 glutathionylspermidine synthase family protein [Dactylosporangium matsuzakiense]GLL04534.1 putative glutathionylspermidine synthase [Dactylosporangium matsuzakiense]